MGLSKEEKNNSRRKICDPIRKGDKQVGKHMNKKTRMLENHNTYIQRTITVV
jgi:hypothetical protein